MLPASTLTNKCVLSEPHGNAQVGPFCFCLRTDHNAHAVCVMKPGLSRFVGPEFSEARGASRACDVWAELRRWRAFLAIQRASSDLFMAGFLRGRWTN